MKLFSIGSALLFALPALAAPTPAPPTWTDAATAEKEVEHFSMIGEYVAKAGKTALQANLLANGEFLVAIYQGGLPGDGWDQSNIDSRKMPAAHLTPLLAGYAKVERKSPTLGIPAPKNAVLKFPDGFTHVKDGIMSAGGQTTKDLGAFHMHLEFMLPLKPGDNPTSQKRGNSGIYIFNNYEIQILDSFAVDYRNPANNALKPESSNLQWCGALYKTKLPDVNMSYPPLRWQTYDIDFKPPEFDGETKTKNARVTVRLNGVLIHDDFELKTGTGNGAKKPQLAKGPVFFQNHANPVVFRNVWVTE
ncbi:DUF1080 domain-containing protein [Pontiella sp.]|uniref:3-keto-disaccharide hydrolase n=1 Tax=Pontiella sp. TaxID=2837462 RepID=UPI0035637277